MTVRSLARKPLTRALTCLALAAGMLAFPTTAPVAAGESALTLVRGPDDAEVLDFSLEELEALPQATIVTANEFTDGEVAYRGPLVRDVLEHLALDTADTIRFTAANDYYVDVPTSDFRKYNVILAIEADGKRLSRRDKGPLWMMYPISENPELRDPVYNTRLIWQVVRIESL